jgi:hypothetical protein
LFTTECWHDTNTISTLSVCTICGSLTSTVVCSKSAPLSSLLIATNKRDSIEVIGRIHSLHEVRLPEALDKSLPLVM